MTEDRKIRQFLDRVVAMTPPSPNFPQEIEMTLREPERRRPVLALVTAAALVILLAVPVMLLNRETPPLAGSSTTTTVSTPSTSVEATSTTNDSTTTTDDTSVTTAPVASIWSRPVFLVAESANSFLGNPALVPIWLEVTDRTGDLSTDAQFTEVLSRVESLPFDNVVPADVQILELIVTEHTDGDETWIADMSEAFVAGAGGLLADVTMLNQLVYTITYESAVQRVLFTVNSEPVGAFGSEGIVLDEPVGRDDYIDELALIFVTQPVLERDGVYLVAGTANTFEASLVIRVIDTDGESDEIVFEQPVSATCGSGCWGTFQAEIDSGLITPGLSSIQLLTYSARDGSPENIVTIPIPEDGMWMSELRD